MTTADPGYACGPARKLVLPEINKTHNMKAASFFYLLVLVFAISCSSSKISSTWISPDARTMAYGKVAVLAIVKNEDTVLREKMETHMTGDLKKLGYSAFSTLKAYGSGAFRSLPETEVVQRLKASGADAVITIVLLDKQKEKYYTTLSPSPVPGNPQESRFWNYYTSLSDKVFTSGYYGEATRYFWESRVYDIRANRLVCSLKTSSFEPASASAMGHEYGKLIVGRLAGYAILIPAQNPE